MIVIYRKNRFFLRKQKYSILVIWNLLLAWFDATALKHQCKKQTNRRKKIFFLMQFSNSAWSILRKNLLCFIILCHARLSICFQKYFFFVYRFFTFILSVRFSYWFYSIRCLLCSHVNILLQISIDLHLLLWYIVQWHSQAFIHVVLFSFTRHQVINYKENYSNQQRTKQYRIQLNTPTYT